MATAPLLSASLRAASFRGVPFKVEASDLSAGRRNQVHEYPQRDKPYVEDLGRATREFRLTAFVVGPDYVNQADKLLAALEEAGPGQLVHPWKGTLTVSVREPAQVSYNTELGVARFSLSFVEAGELAYPAASDATQSKSRLAAGKLEDSAVSSFAKKFSVTGYADFVTSSAKAELQSLMGAVTGTGSGLDALRYAAESGTVLNTAISLLSDPHAMAQKLVGWLGVADSVGTALNWAGISRSLSRLTSSSGMQPVTASTVAAQPVITPNRQQQVDNTNALRGLFRQTLIAQAVGTTSYIDIARQSDTTSATGSSVVVTQDEALAVRNEVAASLDTESYQVADDATYTALQDARIAVWRDITDRARDGARLMVYTPKQVVPALVLAYDRYEDALRDAEIVTRNNVRDPNFVPVVPLRLLSV